jgi:hypothetical protein
LIYQRKRNPTSSFDKIIIIFIFLYYAYPNLFWIKGFVVVVVVYSAWVNYLPWFFNCAVKLGVGGFSMGAAMALYSATCFVHGKYSNGNPYPVNLSVAVGLSGWLPCARYFSIC